MLILTAVGFFCACLISSSNYVLNEILDAAHDRHHPQKSGRPVPSGEVNLAVGYALWLGLAILGVGLSLWISVPFALAGLSLWIMGLFYNVPPVRLKDLPYLDVLSESVNNPIRLAMGWYAVYAAGGLAPVPPASVVLAYWMFGAFLMAVKRFAEYREIGSPEQAANYRKSFARYNEERLLVSIIFYGAFFGMMSGVFVARYRLELVLATPLVAYAMAYYLHLGFKTHSCTQHPENLFREKKLMVLVALAFGACVFLLFYDMPAVHRGIDAFALPAYRLLSPP
jgi:4-hydroxybenzoate polyprenyltransferase